MLHAYFDERNTSAGNRVAIVAGFIGSSVKWKHFSKRWKSLLSEFCIRPEEFHRTSLQALKGHFRNWDTARRDAFLARAYRIIQNNKAMPIGHAVRHDDFQAILPHELKTNLGGPYGWCAFSCLHSVRFWCEQEKRKDDVRYVFEGGARGLGQILRTMDRIYKNDDLRKEFRLHSYGVAGKDMMPLHAGDMIAFDLGRYAENVMLGLGRPGVNEYLLNLLGEEKPKYSSVRFWNEEALRDFALPAAAS